MSENELPEMDGSPSDAERDAALASLARVMGFDAIEYAQRANHLNDRWLRIIDEMRATRDRVAGNPDLKNVGEGLVNLLSSVADMLATVAAELRHTPAIPALMYMLHQRALDEFEDNDLIEAATSLNFIGREMMRVAAAVGTWIDPETGLMVSPSARTGESADAMAILTFPLMAGSFNLGVEVGHRLMMSEIEGAVVKAVVLSQSDHADRLRPRRGRGKKRPPIS